MLVVDGVVKTLNIEGPGKFEVSDADTMLAPGQSRLRGLMPRLVRQVRHSLTAARDCTA